MKRLTFLLFTGLLIVFNMISAYPAEEFIVPWAVVFGENKESQYINDIVVDNEGNIYAAGKTTGDFDGNTCVAGHEAFVIKYSSAGIKQWTKLLGEGWVNYADQIAADSLGNVYIVGTNEGGTINGVAHQGQGDIFLAKFDSNGNKIWSRHYGTTTYDRGFGITVDSSNNIYVTGYTSGDLDGETRVGSDDYFITKFDSDGTKKWTILDGSTSWDCAYSICADDTDGVYVTGYVNGSLHGKTHVGNGDLFYAKYNSSGVYQFSNQLGSTMDDQGTDIFYKSGYCAVLGQTGGDFDGNTKVGNDGDYALVKFQTSDGVKQWSLQNGPPNLGLYAYSVTIDDSNDILSVGSTSGTFPGWYNHGLGDVWVTKHNSSGTFQWSYMEGTAYPDDGCGIVALGSNQIFIGGDTRGNFLGESHTADFNYFDIFLFKLAVNNIPELSWTGEANYVTDGLDPETGTAATTFTYKVKYTDLDNDAPLTGYPKIYIKSGGTDITGSPFTMNYVSGSNNTGAVYSYAVQLNPGTDYTYFFEAYDINNSTATGDPNSAINAPDVSNLPRTIAGTITDGSNPLENVTVNLTGGSNTSTTTNSSGYFAFTNLTSGLDYTVTPNMTHWSFTPLSRTYNNLVIDQNNCNFTGTLNTWDISGSIINGSTPISGVTVTLSGDSTDSVITGTDGQYLFKDLPAGCTYIVNPAKSGLEFIPESKTFINLSEDVIQNFIKKSDWADNLNNIIVYPNPWQINQGTQGIIFGNLTENVEIKIYNIAGELVKTIKPDKSNYLWEIANEDISAGIYIYILTNDKGEEKKGKIGITK
ncbi:MAG: SBBP repeat-containing protein [bacterium]|nr:SBBP repeat-containing protein [bacterium]